MLNKKSNYILLERILLAANIIFILFN